MCNNTLICGYKGDKESLNIQNVWIRMVISQDRLSANFYTYLIDYSAYMLLQAGSFTLMRQVKGS